MNRKDENQRKLEKAKDNICKLYVGNNFEQTRSTAVLFHYGNEWIALTAAHCVFSRDGKVVQNIFLKFHLKKIKILKIIVHEEWIKNENIYYDYAFLQLQKSACLAKNASKNIFIGFKKNLTKKQMIIGYSAIGMRKRVYIGEFMQDTFYRTNLIGLKADTLNGLSGSPWIAKSNNIFRVEAVTSLSFDNYPNVLWGVPIQKNVYLMIESLIKDKKANYLMVFGGDPL